MSKTTASVQRPLAGFDKLSDATHLYQPPPPPASESSLTSDNNNNNKNQLSLIVVCTWLGADLKHVAKYTSAYQRLYPHSSILVLQSSLADVVYRSNHTQQKRLTLARDVVLEHYSQGASKVFLHAFSNGGAQTAFNLAATLPPAQREGVFCGLVLDSCPGRFEFKSASNAMAVSFPKSRLPFAHVLGPAIVHVVLLLMVILQAHGVQNTVTQARLKLNDKTLFGLRVPRLYAYSRADEMVFWKDVQDHAEEARQKGYKAVYALPFTQSRHCAHMMEDGTRYWDAVGKLIDGDQ